MHAGNTAAREKRTNHEWRAGLRYGLVPTNGNRGRNRPQSDPKEGLVIEGNMEEKVCCDTRRRRSGWPIRDSRVVGQVRTV
jgi:hypothetical protein